MDDLQLEDRAARARRSGSEHNPLIREKRLVRFLLSILLGKPTLVQHFVGQLPGLRTSSTRCPSSRERMDEVTGDGALDAR